MITGVDAKFIDEMKTKWSALQPNIVKHRILKEGETVVTRAGRFICYGGPGGRVSRHWRSPVASSTSRLTSMATTRHVKCVAPRVNDNHLHQ